jgi:hypothetical protein
LASGEVEGGEQFMNFDDDPNIPKEAEKMTALVSANEELDFGVSNVRKLSFVYNDWYQRAEKVTVLRDYLLR